MSRNSAIRIEAFDPAQRSRILQLSMKAWSPVFEALEPAVPGFVFRCFYPAGWEIRQEAEIDQFLQAEAANVIVAYLGDELVGWVGLRSHPEDQMGEIYILAVDPAAQRQGVANALLESGFARLKAAGMAMVMVETGDDPGHLASRRTYESQGFERWPVARYFRPL